MTQRYPPSTDRPSLLDVGARRSDVVLMARSHEVWRTAVALGWDPDDLEQEILLRVHQRQSMASRYNPARAGLGKYLFVLTRSILINLVEMGLAKKTGVSVRKLRRLRAEGGEAELMGEVALSESTDPGLWAWVLE